MPLLPALDAASQLESEGLGVKVVAILSPRRLYRPQDVLWETCAEADGQFLDDAGFAQFFGGDALIGITGGSSALLEPLLLRSTAPRDIFAWKRGETTASAGQLMAFNGITADAIRQRALALLG
jgi:phosphoketolase